MAIFLRYKNQKNMHVAYCCFLFEKDGKDRYIHKYTHTLTTMNANIQTFEVPGTGSPYPGAAGIAS
jgi:hypothetical protein